MEIEVYVFFMLSIKGFYYDYVHVGPSRSVTYYKEAHNDVH